MPDYPVSLIIYFGVIGDYMDLIEAKRNLESLHQDKEKLQIRNVSKFLTQ